MVASLDLERDDLREKLRQEDALILLVLVRPFQQTGRAAEPLEHECDGLFGLAVREVDGAARSSLRVAALAFLKAHCISLFFTARRCRPARSPLRMRGRRRSG